MESDFKMDKFWIHFYFRYFFWNVASHDVKIFILLSNRESINNNIVFLQFANSFSGGLFLGIGLFHLLPEGIDNLEDIGYKEIPKQNIFKEYRLAYVLFFLAYTLIFFIEKVAFSNSLSFPESATNSTISESSKDDKKEIQNVTGRNFSIGTINDNSKEELLPSSKENLNSGNDRIENMRDLISNRNKVAHMQFRKELRKNQNNDKFQKSQSLSSLEIRKKKNILNNEKELDDEDDSELEGQLYHKNDDNNQRILITSFILLFAFGIHGFFEGLALGIQHRLDGTAFLLIGIVSHKWAESLTLGISFVRNKTRSKTFFLSITFFACFEPLGVLTGIFLSKVGNIIEGISATLSSGTFLYVACSEVIVEEFAVTKYKWSKFFLYFAGAVIAFGMFIMEKTIDDIIETKNKRL